MLYMITFEGDSYARDVTRRYLRKSSAKVAKVQGKSGTARGEGMARVAWWKRVIGVLRPYYRLICSFSSQL